MRNLSLALDWSVNANHIIFLVAVEKGFYSELDINLEIQSPFDDNYARTPAKKIELGIADLALCPLESVLSYRTKKNPFDLIAIASLFQKDLSAIACSRGSNIQTAKDLDGKTYASYNARYEDSIVRSMVKQSGGVGDVKIVYPNKLGIWNTILNNRAEATWVFLNWEALMAEAEGIDLVYLDLESAGVPYSYSPIIAANGRFVEERGALFKDFLRASRKGFYHALKNPLEAKEILLDLIPASERSIDLGKSIKMTLDAMGSLEEWGKIDIARVNQFLSWLKINGIENQKLDAKELIVDTLI
jgi:ABC-type nitrate/sulfonate/bicarbonate transport system substrate-binding protein